MPAGIAGRMMRDARDFAERHAPVGAGDGEHAVRERDVARRGLEKMRGDLLALLDDLHCRAVEGRAADRDRARAEGAGAVRHLIGVAFDDLDIRHRHAEARRDDLGEGGGVALAVIVGAEQRLHAAVHLHADRCGFEEADARAQGRGKARRRDAGGLHVAGKAEAAALSGFRGWLQPGVWRSLCSRQSRPGVKTPSGNFRSRRSGRSASCRAWPRPARDCAGGSRRGRCRSRAPPRRRAAPARSRLPAVRRRDRRRSVRCW